SESKLTLDGKRHKDLTIESANPDKPAVIEGSPGTPVLVEAISAEGFHLRNLEIDGRGADVGIQLTGACPGATIQNVTVRNVKSAGFKLLNTAGEAGRAVVLERCRVLLGP